MKSEKSRVLLLGPQRFKPTLASAVRSLGIEGTIATVTAGWQEREAEDDELSEHLSGRAVNLRLHERAEEIFEADAEFAAAHRERQENLRQIQVLYRVRLDHLATAVRELMEWEADRGLIEAEVEDAIEAIRCLDARHLDRVKQIHTAFETRWRPFERPSVARHRRQIAAAMEQASGLALAGGHVAVLLNRARLFGILEMARGRPVLAWSAGAMILSERVVIYHDAPPHGSGNPEILDAGLGLFPGVVPLPHARVRLRMDDRNNVSFFARRFAPAVCVAMDQGARLDCDGAGCTAGPGTMRLAARGVLEPMVHA